MEDLKRTQCEEMEQVISFEKSCGFKVISKCIFEDDISV